MRQIANVNVGRADIAPSRPSHVRGVRSGNSTGHLKKEKGFSVEGQRALGSAARSTGINAADRDPIDPRMPNLSPS